MKRYQHAARVVFASTLLGLSIGIAGCVGEACEDGDLACAEASSDSQTTVGATSSDSDAGSGVTQQGGCTSLQCNDPIVAPLSPSPPAP